jgi:DNA-binding beta-propeller fold protein YncE
MTLTSRILPVIALAACAVATLPADVQTQMIALNPYATVPGVWAELPDGRSWGSTSAIYPAPDGMSIWVAERCGANSCADSDVDPILRYDLDGNLMTSFGGGMIYWPHGLHVDREGNVWIADAVGYGPEPEGRGHEIIKFSPEGEVLMRLGEKGNPGNSRTQFLRPSDLLVAPDGSLFVVDGHHAGGNNRVVKFDAEGNFMMEWGETGTGNGQFRDPHALAMDSQGRLFVGDRANSRIQIFTQNGEHLATWHQFGRPSGLFIDENDVLYSADSESNTARNAGWRRGIYIGSAATGFITAFIPDPEPDPDNSGTSAAEGVAVDAMGNVYGAEVGPRMLRKYVQRRSGVHR